MFRRKRSSSHHQPLNTTPSPSAQTAASHAFLASRASNSSLSSAAAAAALRNLTPTPTPVENVQTKRMLQRQSSISSAHGSIGPGMHQGGTQSLRRASSSASMTARKFRDQSPRRPVSSGGPPRSAPPVPPLPQELPSRTASHRRSVSLEPPTRVMSPPIKRPSGRGTSLDRAPNAAASHSSHRVSSLTTVPELERAASRGSINFSYPITVGPNSPRQSPSPIRPESSQSNFGEQSSVDGLSAAEAENVQYSVSQASEKPVKKKARALAPGSAEGSHLAAGTTGGHPTGTAVAAAQAVTLPLEGVHRSAARPSESEPKPTKERRRSSTSSEDQIAVYGTQVAGVTPTAETADNYSVHQHQPLRPKPKKRPSTVREDHEGEEQAEGAEPGDRNQTGSRFSHVRVSTPEQSTVVLTNTEPADEALVIQGLSTTEVAKEPPAGQSSLSPENRLSVDSGWEERRLGRPHSISPNRSARFSTQLTVSNNGEPLHQPPPRSMSPAKSAMKQSPQQSLSPDRRIGIMARPGQAPSEISDGTSVASDEGSRFGSRKKPAKVSFDDETEIVGVAASPPTSPEEAVPESPPGKTKSKMNWFSLSKKKSTAVDAANGDEFGEFLKPRPALPSFGSIRGSSREVEQEEPVKESTSDNESAASMHSNSGAVEFGLSSDHAIGGILANAKPIVSERRSETDKLDEPIAPEVTTVEGTGYDSNSDEYSPLDLSYPAVINGDQDREITVLANGFAASEMTDTSLPHVADVPTAAGDQNETIPVIAVQPATPGFQEERPSIEWDRIPGGFPSSTSQTNLRTEEIRHETPTTQRSPVSAADANETDEDSGDSVYSDAAEDLSDFEGDGFGSINAIVESPVRTTIGSRMTTPSRVPIQLASPKTTPSSDREATSPTVQRDTGEETVAIPQPTSAQESIDEPHPFQSPYPPWSTTRQFQEGRASSPPIANMKKSMRPMSADPHEGAYLRNALRAPESKGNIANKRHSMSASPVGRKQKAPLDEIDRRPVSSGSSLQNGVRSGTVGKRADQRGSHQSTSFPGVLRRTTSNGSDSSSSFKRSRRSSKDDGHYALRRTMRSSGGPRPQSPPDRPTSESGRRPLSSGSGSGMMRTTLRGPGGTGSQQDRSSIFSGLGKSSKAKPAGQFMSRFDYDSDGEATGRSQKFHSRFEDSSDDEPAAATLRPVRGIPRRHDANDGDSTDLDDSSDDEAPAATQPVPASTEAPSDPAAVAASIVRGMSQAELEEYLSHPPRRGRTGIFSRLTSKRNRQNDKRIRKSSLESPARRDTPLERSRVELDNIRGDRSSNGGYGGNVVTTVTANNIRPSSPKLQKRGLNKTNGHDSWPLMSRGPPPETENSLQNGEEDQEHSLGGLSERPRTSAGIIKNGSANLDSEPRTASDKPENGAGENPWTARFRPKAHSRRGTDSTIDSASDVVVGRNGKKKRFPLLRRAFGLRD